MAKVQWQGDRRDGGIERRYPATRRASVICWELVHRTLSHDTDERRIRNYMSKPWFLQMTLEAEKTSLAKQIENILKPAAGALANDALKAE